MNDEKQMDAMSVQDVIDRLMEVEDKSQPFEVEVSGCLKQRHIL